jgi:hypothetical protein
MIEIKDNRISDLENLVEILKAEIARLEEYEWMYLDLMN